MKIRILGFEWDGTVGLPLTEFYNNLVGLSAEHQAILGRMLSEGVEAVPPASRPDRIICVDRTGPLWRGMLIKLRNARSFLTVVRDNAAILKLTAEQLQQNKAMAEVNFFVLNEVTGRGLYQHYHLSSHLDAFCAFCRTAYEKEAGNRRRELQQKLAEGRITRELANEGMAKLGNTLSYSVMVRRENLTTLINELEQISSVDIVAATRDVSNDRYRPLAESAMRQQVRYVFGRQATRRRERIKQAVLSVAQDFSRERKVRVVGMLPGKLQRVLDLEENYDVLGELDYDETAKDLQIDFSDLRRTLTGSRFIQHLVELANRADVKQRLEAPRI